MKLLLTHVADLDGISPIILMNLINENFEYKLFEVKELSNYIDQNINSDFFSKYDEIFIVDLGIERKTADNIINSKYNEKFKLFDHHESNYYLNNYDFALVKEDTDGFKECGTTLFYQYLKEKYNFLNKEIIKTYVEMVRENDTWQFSKYKKESRDLSALLNFYGIQLFVDKFTYLLKEKQKFYFDKSQQEILVSLNRDLEEYLKSLENKVIFKSIDNYNIGFVFAEKYRSELGDYIAKLYSNKIDFVCIINLNRHISIRGINTAKPVNKFAQSYGGGGHPMAAAMPYPEDLKEKIIDYVFLKLH